MNVLISGGIKTINIVKSIKPRFASGGAEFIVENNIDNIGNVLAKGVYFDRALIIEQSWTKDGEESNEIQARKRISELVSIIQNKCARDVTFIFLCATENMASIVTEETLAINGNIRIILKQPPYTVKFFTTLITSDLDNIPDSYVYKQKEYGEDNPYNYNDKLTPAKDTRVIENTPSTSFETITDFDKELFGASDTFEEDTESTKEEFNREQFDEIDTLEDEDIDISDEEDTLWEDELLKDIGSIDTEDIDTIDSIDTEDIDTIEDDDTEELDADNNSWENESQEPFDGEVETQEELQSLFSEDYNDNLLDEEEGIDNTQSLKPNANKKEPMGSAGGDKLNSNNQYKPANNNYKPIKQTNNLQGFSEDEYKNEVKATKIQKNTDQINPIHLGKNNVEVNELITMLNTFSTRGSSLVVTGTEGSGISTIAYNLANCIVNLGYSVLLVDLDTVGRSQAYMTKDSYVAVHSHDPNNASLKVALNNPAMGVSRYVNILRPGFNLLTMGLGGDIVKYQELTDRKKVLQFANIVRDSYNFIIYDSPLEMAINYCSDITYTADNIVFTLDCSTWGVMKALLAIANIEISEMQELMFNRAQMLFNKDTQQERILGARVRNTSEVLQQMDNTIQELIGEDPGYYFSDMRVCGVVPYDTKCKEYWLGNKSYSDYKEGNEFFAGLLKNILFKR